MRGSRTFFDRGDLQDGRARRVRPVELLNASWHGFSPSAVGRRCGACLEPLRVEEDVVHAAGGVFHPRCAPYGVRSPLGANAPGP